MSDREKLIEICFREFCNVAGDSPCGCDGCPYGEYGSENDECFEAYKKDKLCELEKNGLTAQQRAYWQYIEDDVDEDNNIQAYCSACGAGDKHATSMIGKVPYCWKCGRKMMPEPPKEDTV